MSDTSPQSTASTPRERDELLREARRRLAQLEIETHRLRAELARLEAAGEDDAAAAMAKRLAVEEAKLAAEPRLDLPEPQLNRQHTPTDQQPKIKSRSRSPKSPPGGQAAFDAAAPLGEKVDPVGPIEIAASKEKRKEPRRWLRGVPAWSVSLVTHVALLLLLAAVTFAIQQDQRDFLHANAMDGEDPFDDFAEISLETPELELEDVSEELTPSELSETLVDDLQMTLDSAALGLETDSPAAIDALPTSMAGLMAGETGGAADGTVGAGKQVGGGMAGGAQFFGSRSKGNRFVFVVDNSASMTKGRMETTLLELANSISAMKPDQEFHVLFYSDQIYPMFFPQSVNELLPATKENRYKMEQWFATVETCLGGKMKDAMDYAASLKPHVVYLLCDGADLHRSENGRPVPTLVFEYLTKETTDWDFTVHTLGMTVRNQTAAEALALVAQAHGGTFTPVVVNPVAEQMARQRPIPVNRTRGRVWGSKVRK